MNDRPNEPLNDDWNFESDSWATSCGCNKLKPLLLVFMNRDGRLYSCRPRCPRRCERCDKKYQERDLEEFTRLSGDCETLYIWKGSTREPIPSRFRQQAKRLKAYRMIIDRTDGIRIIVSDKDIFGRSVPETVIALARAKALNLVEGVLKAAKRVWFRWGNRVQKKSSGVLKLGMFSEKSLKRAAEEFLGRPLLFEELPVREWLKDLHIDEEELARLKSCLNESSNCV